MSLLEDILHVLRMVLEYFGAPPEMLVPVWDCDLCGQYRSIVRMIGTNLPLQPLPRVHFQIPLIANKPHMEISVDIPTIPSFADILWVCEDEGNSSTRTRNYLSLNKHNIVYKNINRTQRPISHQNQRAFSSLKPAPEPDALKKISALETELLKLRAQIAMIVTAPPASDLDCTPMMSPPSPPALTSTPLRPAAPQPPPPPPPPPSCPSISAPVQSISELIKARKQNNNKNPSKAQDNAVTEERGPPSMLDVLKDLNQVKLRCVQRSPGGTPVRKRRSRGGAALHNDPAALIAEALKKKFAGHYLNNSSDKENSRELSPFSSPDSPKFPHHRRSQGRRYM
ncbi:hypothetical protein WMY93_015453 [Mugilogobius chulae]|uniref:Mitochondrial fission regulator n=1 Tax=Mugilogobius chulae TaxID=88201 RepID=A0AAW0P0G9_9GOBI